MAAKSKKRLPKIENKLIKLEKLELKDIICTICQSILIEPVTLPCFHDFCNRCFNGTIENNALCCPLCRLRIGSWLRTATKQNSLVNRRLWNFIKTKFSKEIDKKLQGEDLDVPTEVPILPRISEPGEIRLEYEIELKRLRDERLRLEEKQIIESKLLIRKLHQEEIDANNKYLERLKQDELLAKQIQRENEVTNIPATDSLGHNKSKDIIKKSKLKAMKIDNYLSKTGASCTVTGNSQTTNEKVSNKITTAITNSNVSPEIVPNYSRLLKSYMGKNVKNETHVWNKENGDSKVEEKVVEMKKNRVENNDVRTKNGLHSLLVSLPLPQTKIIHCNKIKNKSVETDSVDSMQQELCYFKPIEGNSPTSFANNKDLPLRVPSVRPETEDSIFPQTIAPCRDLYLEGLYKLRESSFARKLPSAFVIAPNILRSKEQNVTKNTTKVRVKKNACVEKVNENTQNIDGVRVQSDYCLRRTRSMGSITKDEGQVTPRKKGRERKVCSDKKPYLRSDSKKTHTKKRSCSPMVGESININKVKLAVKNLSSPLENCDVKSIVQEQLRIEMIIEQEKNDLELAKKMDAELNGRRQPRRAANKRQVTLNYALRPAKKLKV